MTKTLTFAGVTAYAEPSKDSRDVRVMCGADGCLYASGWGTEARTATAWRRHVAVRHHTGGRP